MEHNLKNQLDPVSIEVIRNKLEGIANEMQHSLLRSAFSPIVKEGLDASASLFTLKGETLAQSIAIPIHLGTLIPIVEEILRRNPVDTLVEGDVFIINDPYLGGTHLPDIALIMPIFAEGLPLGFSAAMVHHQDVGGMAPGSVPTNATEIFQEGIRIPPLKLISAGATDDNLVQILRQNVRMPDEFMGDINSQIAACNVGQRRLHELATAYGAMYLLTVFDTLLDRSEQMTREALAKIPSGEYRYTDYLDNDGINLNQPIQISVNAIVCDGEVTFDLDQSSRQVDGPFNCVPSGSLSAACFAVRVLTGSDIPTNGGCFRPIHLKLPEGSIVNPSEPAAVNSRTATIKRLAGSMISAFREVLPEKVTADAASEIHTLQFGGQRPDGRRFVVGEMIASGSGAGITADGVDVIETDGSNCMNLPVEALELDAPIRVHRFELRKDSGGPGERRGGLGVTREYQVLDGEIKLTHRGERHFCAAQGYNGGLEGANAYSAIIRSSGRKEVIPSKIVTSLKENDRLIIETAGGGGYGSPEQRPQERILADVVDGKVSREKANLVYKWELKADIGQK